MLRHHFAAIAELVKNRPGYFRQAIAMLVLSDKINENSKK